MAAKVLLVEADATAGADLRDALVARGYVVTLTRDGALGLTRAVTERFDAIVVAAELPGINGFRIVNRIRKAPSAPSARVFVIGGEDDALAAHERLPSRADSYFRRPVIVDELVARMRLHGVGDAPAEARVEIAAARAEIVTIAELRRTIEEQGKTLERTTTELAGARAALARKERRGPGSPEAAPSERLLRDRLTALEKEHAAGASDARAAAARHESERKALAKSVIALESELSAATEREAARVAALEAARERELSSIMASLAERQARIDLLERRIAELEAARSGLESEKSEVLKSTADLAFEVADWRERAGAEEKSRRQAEIDLETARRELASFERSRASAVRDHALEIARLNEAHARDLDLAAGGVARLRRELGERESARAKLEARLAEVIAEAVTREKALAERVSEARDALDGFVAGADAEVREERERLVAAFEEERRALDARAADARAVLEERLRLAETHGDELAAARGDAGALAKARLEVDHLRRVAEVRGKHGAGAVERRDRTIEELRAELADLRARTGASEEALVRDRDEARRAAGSASAGASSRIRELEARLEERTRIVAELERRLVEAAARPDTDPREHAWAAERAALQARMHALEASVASRDDEILQLEWEIDEAHDELPQLEAEIVVLRSEVMNLRRQLDTHVLHEQAIVGQLERHDELLARAERLLDAGRGGPR